MLMEDTDPFISQLPLMTFDAESQFNNFTPMEATQYIYDH